MHPRRVLHRVRLLLSRRAAEIAMDAEMRHHIECETADRIARGLSPQEARRTALRDFGGIERYKEAARDRQGFRWLAELQSDARYATRTLRRAPGYTIASVSTFALGIGLTTSIFGMVHGILLRPLPYADPDRLVAVWERHPARAVERNVVSVPNFEAWRVRARSFAGLVALVPAPVTLGRTDPERVMGAEVSPGYFRLLGVAPAVGRAFTNVEVTEEDARSVILSHGLWRRRFGGDSSIVGRAISLDARPFTVVGIMPRAFDPPRFGWLPDHELWLPFVPTPDNRSWGRFLLVIGRLREDISVDVARGEMTAIADRLAREQPSNDGWSATVVRLSEQITGEVERPLTILMGAVVLLLVLSATNVGSLTLAFLRRREQELAVRQAIGASTSRLFRQILAHCLVVGAAGCTLGIAAAVVGTSLLTAILPVEVPRRSTIGVDAIVLAFGVGICVLLTASLAVIATVRSLAGGVDSLAIGRGQSGRSSPRVGGGSLVAAEIALGVILTVLAGLMIRSVVNLRAVPLGFDARGVTTARVSLPTKTYGTPERQRAFFEAWRERLAALPGMTAVSFATTRPFACCAPSTVVSNGERSRPVGGPLTADVRYVDSSFFAALRIPVVFGRAFGSREPTDGEVGVVVNRALARTLWPAANAVGQQLEVAMFGGLDARVLGIVGDVHLADARTLPRATVYLPASRYPSTVRDVIVRASTPPGAVVGALRSTIRSIDPTLPLYEISTLENAVDGALAEDRFTTTVLSIFAIVSLVLAAVGTYGIVAGEVAARRKEIGIRIALGAQRRRVLGGVLRRGLSLATIGAAVGVVAGLMLARAMSSLVFDVTTSDPASFVAVVALLVAVAVVATLIPAVRAASVSPLEAIRTD